VLAFELGQLWDSRCRELLDLVVPELASGWQCREGVAAVGGARAVTREERGDPGDVAR